MKKSCAKRFSTPRPTYFFNLYSNLRQIQVLGFHSFDTDEKSICDITMMYMIIKGQIEVLQSVLYKIDTWVSQLNILLETPDILDFFVLTIMHSKRYFLLPKLT